MSRWIDRNGGHYCTVHDAEFSRGEICMPCSVEPGPPPGNETKETDDERDLKVLAAEFRSRGKRFYRAALDLLEDGTDRDVTAACKASAEAAKWERLALECRDRYAPKQETDDLIREVRKLRGQDGSN